MAERPIVVDFETAGIERRPVYPPVPCSVSVREPGDRKSRFYAWGHDEGNNCTKAEATRVLKRIWTSGKPLLFQNAKFDVDVAETHLGLAIPPWHLIHDTMYLLFLDDPHAMSLSLKPSAERLLGMPPEEQDAVRRWLEDHKIVRKNQKDWGAYISKAPGTVVGPYANGDVDRTLKLFQLLYPKIRAAGSIEAYDRERQLMPVLLCNEREGMRCDVKALREDAKAFEQRIMVADEWLRKRLKTKDLNVDSDDEVANALEKCNVVTEFAQTAKGNRSVSKKNLTPGMFSDQRVAAMLGYRNRLSTCLGTFAKPWLGMAEQSGGVIYTNWNQVKQDAANGGNKGARTGRLSSNPNFQNIPKDWYDKDDEYVHPIVPSADLLAIAKRMGYDPERLFAADQTVKAGDTILTYKGVQLISLPMMRKYILPDKGGVFMHRDYNQQELRILAHYENGKLCNAYRTDPRVDIHVFVQQEIKKLLNQDLGRRPVKIINFGMIYGQGAASLAVKIHCDVTRSKQLKAAHRAALPDIKALEKEIKSAAGRGEPVVTWGGRPYYCEEPKFVEKFGKVMTFEYKLLNYLIQGSASDCSKQALINYDQIKRDGRFMCSVHDEANASAPKKAVKSEMKLLRQAMEGVPFDVPMITDGKTGPSWGALIKYKE